MFAFRSGISVKHSHNKNSLDTLLLEIDRSKVLQKKSTRYKWLWPHPLVVPASRPKSNASVVVIFSVIAIVPLCLVILVCCLFLICSSFVVSGRL